MNKKLINPLLGLALLGLGATACSDGQKQFVAEGHVTGASGQTLYLEEVGTGNVLSLDSAQLDADGAFRFAREGTYYPMFYRLRLGNQSIPFVADSVTHIVIKADAPTFFTSYTIVEADQPNHQIREISHLRHRTDTQIDSLLAEYNANRIDLHAARTGVDSLAGALKQTLMQRYIFTDPKSPAAYFALFQRKGEGAYFSAEEIGDERAFAAVATAYDLYYATAPYTPFLKDLALRAIARSRARRSWERAAADMPDKVKEVAFPEIALADKSGQTQSLTALVGQGPVLLSFTAYQAQWSPMLVSTLREIQAKRPDLTIYEVSVDGDAYYWQNATRNLSWISVNDPEGKSLVEFNVQSLPAFFLIEGATVKRLESPEEVL